MINFDKFLASFITEMKKYQPITCYNLPGCIKKALEDQGFEYKDGEIVKTQDIIATESEDEKIRKWLINEIKIKHHNLDEDNVDFVDKAIVWLEKQGNPNKEYWKGYKDGKKAILDRYSELKKQDQQEEPQVYEIEDGKVITYSESKGYKVIEPKFKVGDWVVLYPSKIKVNRKVVQISGIERCQLNMYWTTEGTWFGDGTEARLWTIQDAKAGDLLADDYGIYIFDRFDEYDEMKCYLCMGAYQYSQKAYENEHMLCSVEVHPATKEQRDILFQKMHEAGYTFDFEKKELKKLKFRVGDEVITENEESLTITKIDEEGYWSNDLFICGFNTEHIWDLVEQKSTWSEEDDMMLECVLDKIGDLGTGVMCKGWLKSLKNRIKGE